MIKKMQEPANDNAPLRPLDDTELDAAKGGAETVHLYLKANGEDIKGAAAAAEPKPEIRVRTTIRE